jgi:hypothetical protein
MTLLHGMTEAGAELPVLVDAEGRLLVQPIVTLNGLPPGGHDGDLLVKSGSENYKGAWVSELDLLPASFGFNHRPMASIPTGAPPTVQKYGDAPLFLNGASFDAVSGRITPAIAGYWLIVANIRVNSTIQQAILRLKLNGGEIKQARRASSASGELTELQVSYLGLFNGATDYVTTEVEHSSGASRYIDNSQAFGILLSPA